MKQQELLRRLKASYLALLYGKWSAQIDGLDMEHADRIPELRARFAEIWSAAHEKGLDPAAVCVRIIRRYWRTPDQR